MDQRFLKGNYAKHVVYWRRLSDGGIVTVLREKMHQLERLREDFGDAQGASPPP